MRILSTCLFLVLAQAATAQSVSDDFNRPNSTNMGPDWSEQNGDMKIEANHGVGGFAFSNNWMYHTGFSQTYDQTIASVTFHHNNKTSGAVGLVLGLDPNTWGGLAVKLQDNDGDMLFDRLFFEAAINAGAWFNNPTPIIYDLPTQLAQGRMTLSTLDADTALCEIFDATGQLVGSYQAAGITGGSFPPVGDRVAIWAFNTPSYDDFNASLNKNLVGSPTSLSVAAGGSQTLNINLGTAHALELYLMLGNFSGTAPGTPAGNGFLLPLNVDSYFLQTLSAPNTPPLSGSFGSLDAQGRASATFTLPAGLTPAIVGLTVNHAAVSFTVGGSGATVTAATDAASLTLTP